MKRLFVGVIAASLLLGACSKQEDKFVGHYDGKMVASQEIIDMVKSNASRAGEDPDEVEAKMTGAHIGMVLRRNGTLTMTTGSDDKAESEDGTWTLNEEATQITIQDARAEARAPGINFPMGRGFDMVLDVSEDGKTLSYDQTQRGVPVKITFTRQ